MLSFFTAGSGRLLCFLVACLWSLPAAPPLAAEDAPVRWSAARANAWYARQPWLVGANYIPSDAINELEMFQEATWNPRLIDHELGLAQGIGMNTLRVFLQDRLWRQDSGGFLRRIDAFLAIAAKHGIRPVLVLFDSCGDPLPRLGPQHPPIPGVHNSGWVQSPGSLELRDTSAEPDLAAYVHGIVGAFADDPRVLAWDVWNEPDNVDAGGFARQELPDKVARVDALLPRAFRWAREAHPTQPLTSGLYVGDWTHPDRAMVRTQLAESDILTFHDYGWPEEFEARIRLLLPYGRPILCTEYMARATGSTFDGDLPLAKRYRVGAINWGLVAGKTQTFYPWDSWQHPYLLVPPTVWFHDIFRQDDTPYRRHEVELIRALTASP